MVLRDTVIKVADLGHGLAHPPIWPQYHTPFKQDFSEMSRDPPLKRSGSATE